MKKPEQYAKDFDIPSGFSDKQEKWIRSEMKSSNNKNLYSVPTELNEKTREKTKTIILHLTSTEIELLRKTTSIKNC